MIGRGPNACLLGHVTGLLFCFYVNFVLISFFKFVDFWSSMSCIPPDIELTNVNGCKDWEFLLIGVFRDTYFVLQNSKHLDEQQTCTDLCATVEVLITVNFPTFFPET